MTEKVYIPAPRHLFVSMLFALVIGAWATKGFDLFQSLLLSPLHWNASFVATCHWFLALVVLLASWKDWTATFGEQEDQLPTAVSYALLSLDVFILLAYFMLVATVRVDAATDASGVFPIAAVLAAIFFLYALWDLVHYVLVLKRELLSALLPPSFSFALGAIVCMAVLLSHETDYEREVAGCAVIALFLVYAFFRWMHSRRLAAWARISSGGS